MKPENFIRLVAGAVVLASLLLAHFNSPDWLWLTAFVGFNLIQSSFTGFCALGSLLKKLGVGKERSKCCS